MLPIDVFLLSIVSCSLFSKRYSQRGSCINFSNKRHVVPYWSIMIRFHDLHWLDEMGSKTDPSMAPLGGSDSTWRHQEVTTLGNVFFKNWNKAILCLYIKVRWWDLQFGSKEQGMIPTENNYNILQNSIFITAEEKICNRRCQSGEWRNSGLCNPHTN